MQWTLILAAVVVVVLGAVVAIGWKLPSEHRVTREAGFTHGVDELWAVVADFPRLPDWMPGVRAVHRLDAVEGKDRWLYETTEGELTIEVVTRAAPTLLAIRTVKSKLAFGGTWTQRISPGATGSLVTITEYGWISNPFFRFMSRYVFGISTTLDVALVALGRHLGDSVSPRDPRDLRDPSAGGSAAAAGAQDRNDQPTLVTD